jgi:GrpB-like predicted nucleotidyltransferase (UPF0157 family)
MDEDQLRAVTIGELTPHMTKIVIADYDPAWPDWFAWDRDRIAAALGPAALSIEHAGSTSVPDLPAKPIIDIVLQVPDSADEDRYLPSLEAAGYVLRVREPDWLEHRLVRRRGEPHDVNVHVFSHQHAAAEIDRMLTFRDWLRTHEDDRNLYATTKRELSTKDWRHVQDYADAKTDVVRQILARARA